MRVLFNCWEARSNNVRFIGFRFFGSIHDAVAVSFQQKCAGVRNRVEKVLKRDYNENHLMSDYMLLEEAGRVVDTANRTCSVIERDDSKGIGEIRRIVAAAQERGTRLTFMPKGFTRRMRNTTVMKSVPHYRTAECGVKGTRLIYWHLDIYFTDPTGNYSGSQLVKLDSVAEDTTVKDAVYKGLQLLCKRNKRLRSTPFISKRNHNRVYDNANIVDLDVYLENEYVPMSTIPIPVTQKLGNLRYDLLDVECSLLNTLKGRAVIEFPIFRIAPKKSSASQVLARENFAFFELPDAESEASSDESDSYSDSDGSESESQTKAKVSENKPTSMQTKVKSANTDSKKCESTHNNVVNSIAKDDVKMSPLRSRASETKLVILRSVPADAIKLRSRTSEAVTCGVEDRPRVSENVDDVSGKARNTASSEARTNLVSTSAKKHEESQSVPNGKSSRTAEKRGRSGVRRSRFGSISQINQGAPGSAIGAASVESIKVHSMGNTSANSGNEEGKGKKHKLDSVESEREKQTPAPGFDSETHPALFDAPLPEVRVPRKKARVQ